MDDPAFAVPSLDLNTQTILLHAANHNLPALKPLLRVPGNASVQDPESGCTPLHAAIAACGSAGAGSDSGTTRANTHANAGDGDSVAGSAGIAREENKAEAEVDIEKAKEVVRELFLAGAIWNDLDAAGETPGCLAWRLGRRELYELVVEAGVRAEMLLGLLGGYEELGDVDSEEENEDEMADVEGEVVEGNGVQGDDTESPTKSTMPIEGVDKRDVNSEDYLKSSLHFADDKLLDADLNGVMMAWETSIMRQSVDLLLPAPNHTNKRILNIGFGMGIVDRMFRDTKPFSHHIIEAHPSVLARMSEPSSEFGAEWEKSCPEGGKYVVHGGRWQEIVPKLLEEGEVFDAIYFDTFGEDYRQLKDFFTEYVVGLLDPEGRFGFFNGLGADRRVCYDVYCRVVELDLCDAGFDVDWINVPVEDLGGEGEGEWKGVRRRYWTLNQYRLPVCSFMG
jgi:protein arginine N-methyltransferase 2